MHIIQLSRVFNEIYEMNEGARTCAYIECDDDLYMSLRMHTMVSLFCMYALRAFAWSRRAVVVVVVVMMIVMMLLRKPFFILCVIADIIFNKKHDTIDINEVY